MHVLLEESAAASVSGRSGSLSVALEKAKEAAKKERQLCKKREENDLGDQNNLELTYAVSFNLAHQYHLNKQYSEALAQYTSVVRNKAFSQGGQLRANLPYPNMGNIHFEQGNWSAAIKQYNQALDNVPASAKEVGNGTPLKHRPLRALPVLLTLPASTTQE